MDKTDLKEGLSHGTPAFPAAVYHNTFDRQHTHLAPLHYHDEFELLLSTKGTLRVQIEESAYVLPQGEGLFINSGMLHSIYAADGTDHAFMAIVFGYGMLCTEHDILYQKYIQPLMSGTLKAPVYLTEEMCHCVRLACSSYEASAFGFELYMKYSLIRILHLCVKDSRTADLPASNAKNLYVKKILNYIEENHSRQISLQDMSDHAHISREYLCRIFRDMSGTSPVEYLNRYRIRQSADLLLHTHRGISDIAFSCGFNNSSYFNKLFLRYMGCSPTEYRKLKGDRLHGQE